MKIPAKQPPKWKPAGHPRDDVVAKITAGRTLAVTEPSGRSHTHGADDGRTGWKRHAVESDAAAEAGAPAACGLRPVLGWGVDLFEDHMPLCRRCAIKLGACRKCSGNGKQGAWFGNTWKERTCEKCDGRGTQP